MNILANARNHFAEKVANGMKVVEVPEWGTEDEPAKIYYSPETVEQRDKYFSGLVENKFEAFALVIITRGKDENGKRLFHDKDLIHFKKALDPDVVVRVAGEIFSESEMTVDDLGK